MMSVRFKFMSLRLGNHDPPSHPCAFPFNNSRPWARTRRGHPRYVQFERTNQVHPCIGTPEPQFDAMTTPRAANRAKAQLSTGPRTDTGKRRAFLNALTHDG